jgi:hypothetical protein
MSHASTKKKLSDCKIEKYECRESSVYATHGLLSKSDNTLTGVNQLPQQARTVTVREPKSNPRRTMYWSWADFKSVDMKEGYVSANDCSFASIEDQESWYEIIQLATMKYEREHYYGITQAQ